MYYKHAETTVITITKYDRKASSEEIFQNWLKIFSFNSILIHKLWVKAVKIDRYKNHFTCPKIS